ncbi:hypothetical protein ACFSQD_07915 [Flavihumibacter stibioxidans]|uniref:Uncharacterized protein n=1 Tax=Flavihumibacter stibioxidans TaxID=1834163 RepID=A0ABR7M5D3_9BACT|nr:hypothetical protein [Flavihumibacter stibioxidans]MBC6490233.1 hypothetical protein [Flavihumibacter stibioxidans]
MSTQNPFEQQGNKLPTFLNVLTILTFIGSAILLFSMPLAKLSMRMTKKALENSEAMDKLSAEQVEEMERTVRTFDLMEANAVPLWIVTILAAVLCVYGAIRMRKLKKEGFYIYAIGEFLPLIGGVIILGFANQFPSTGSYVAGIGFPVLFTVLYATQLRHMN